MDYVELPKYFGVVCGEPPLIDEWRTRLEQMSDNEVERHRVFAIRCLDKDVASQAWAPHIGVAEKILQDRKKVI